MKKIALFALILLLMSSCSGQKKNKTDELVLAKETEHADIYIWNTDLGTEDMIETISSAFENQYDRLADMFQFSTQEKTIIHIYTDKEHFQQIIGRETEGTYDASDNIIKVYTPHDISRDDVREEYTFQVVHEFVHAIIQQINPVIGGIKWLDEGIAYYAAEQLAIDISNQKYAHQSVPDINELFESETYFDEVGGEAYYFSGLIVQFINEQFGSEKLNEIVRDPQNIENILNKSIPGLYSEWEEYVNNLYE